MACLNDGRRDGDIEGVLIKKGAFFTLKRQKKIFLNEIQIKNLWFLVWIVKIIDHFSYFLDDFFHF